MKILLIDNHSKHKNELLALLSNHAEVATQEELMIPGLDEYGLIVLSGGFHVPGVLHNPEAYSKEIELVRTTKTPILGICLGSEIIVTALGGSLQEIGEHKGEVVIKVIDESLKKVLGKDNLLVYESHRVAVKDLPDTMIACAYSEHACEIIKHATRPIIGIQFHPEVDLHKGFMSWVINSFKDNM